MSKKYYDKILSGSGTSGVQVKSAFGAKILAKYGWTEGKGLGKGEDGISECVQISKREEKVGIGAESSKESTEWDNWWTGAYDSVAQKISVKVARDKKEKKKEKKRKIDQEEEQLYKKKRVKRQLREE